MESLMKLVAASFARHGIECPEFVERPASSPVPANVGVDAPGLASAQAIRPAEPTLATALPEHNFRKSLQGDPAP